MGVHGGPKVSSDGLVLSLDAANLKGYDKYENLLQYSEDFSNAYWTKSNVSVTANAIASPSGSSNASKLVESATTAVHELIRGSDGALSVGTDTYITFSIFAKAAERQYCYIRSSGNSKRIAVVVDLSNGTFNVTNWGFTLNSSATVTPYPNGWYRITATAQSNYPAAPGWVGQFIVSPIDSYQSAGSVGGSGYSYAGNGTSGIYIWGAHYEFGPGISDYYATAGTAKTRGTTWTDLSGNGNNGTLTNGPTYSSANGGSIVFDGTNDYVSCGNPSSLQITQGTISAWVKTSSPGSIYRSIIAKQLNYGLFVKDGILITYDWGSGLDRTTGINISDGNWKNVVMSFTTNTGTPSNNAIIYLNGNSILTTTVKLSNNDIEFQIGQGGTSGPPNQYINGNIAQVSIYNRALSAAEIQQNFNALRGRFGI